MSQETGAPVRVQFMRWDEHGWDNFGPAHTADVKIAADADGKLVAYEYHGWQHTWSVTETTAQLAAGRSASEGRMAGRSRSIPVPMHRVNVRASELANREPRVPDWTAISRARRCGRRWTSPFAFASEQMIDELGLPRQHRSVPIPAAEYRRPLAGRPECGRRGGEVEPE